MRDVSLICVSLCIASIACGDDGPTEPKTITLVVSVHTAGGDPDTGYELLVGTELRRSLAPADSARYTLPRGAHLVSLDGVAPNCEVAGENPRTVDVHGKDTARVVFEINCMTTGIVIRTTTSGEDPPGEYSVSISGVQGRVMGLTDSITVSRLFAGAYRVALSFPGENCQVTAGREVTVEVVNRTVSPVNFDVTCTRISRPEAIAFVSDYPLAPGGVIEMIATDGSHGQRFVPGTSPAWSPNGGKIVFSTTSCDYEAWYYYDYTHVCLGGLWLLDPETQALQLVVNGNLGTAPSWSPDSNRIVFTVAAASRNELYIVTLGGTRTKIPIPNILGATDPVWSPDGIRIAFACSVDGPTPDLCTVSPTGTDLVRLTHDSSGVGEPSWSPDGKRIAFKRGLPGLSSEVMVIDADGGNAVFVTNGTHPSWSRDGSKIVFAGTGGIFTVNADGSGVTQLTTGQHRQPAWRR